MASKGRDSYRDVQVELRRRRGVPHGRKSGVRFAAFVKVRMFSARELPSEFFEAYRLRLRLANSVVVKESEESEESEEFE